MAVSSSVYGYSYHSYQTNLKHAETLLSDERYDDSITAFLSLKSSKFSNGDSAFIDSKVKLALELKQSKKTFDAALKLFDEKKYTEAIDGFKNVKDSDKNRYVQAQKKIKEASNLYVTDNITKAKSEADNKNYDNAIGFLDTVLKFDQNNEEATNLKDTYNKEIQSIKDEQAEENASNTAEKVTNKPIPPNISQKQPTNALNASSSNRSSSNSTNSTSTPSNSTSAAPANNSGYTVTFNEGWFGVHLNSGIPTPEGFGIIPITYASDPYGIYYVFRGNNVQYEITFHLPTGDVTKSGVSSNDFCLVPEHPVDVPKNQAIKIDISAIYKGQTYTGSFSKVINSMY